MLGLRSFVANYNENIYAPIIENLGIYKEIQNENLFY